MQSNTSFRHTREQALYTLRSSPSVLVLKTFPNALKRDKNFMLAAVNHFGQALQYSSEELQNDMDVVLAAVRQDGSSLEFASNEMKGNFQIVMESVMQFGEALEYASPDLKNNEHVVRKAVQQSRYALRFASEKWRSKLKNEFTESTIKSEKSTIDTKLVDNEKQFSLSTSRNDASTLSSLFPNKEYYIYSSNTGLDRGIIMHSSHKPNHSNENLPQTSSKLFPNSSFAGNFLTHLHSQSASTNSTPTSGENEIVRFLTNKCEVKQFIAQGGFGFVYHVVDKNTKQHRALKLLNTNDVDGINKAIEEALVMRSITHPHIVQVYSAYMPGVTTCVCIEMELMKGSLFSEFLAKHVQLSETLLRQLTVQICDALEFISVTGVKQGSTKLHILHRDIKPGNILVKQYDLSSETIHVALADFGLSASIDTISSKASLVGTNTFLAPELLRNDLTAFTVASDMFALGVSLYQLMTLDVVLSLGHLALAGKDMKKFIVKQLLLRRTEIPLTCSYTNEFIDLVASMLALQPNQRISYSEVKKKLQP